MKRLTAEEVASDMARLAEIGEVYSGWTTHAAYEHSRDLVRANLIPQWQYAPTEGGWYWIESYADPVYASRRDDGSWRYQTGGGHSIDNYSRVCPIGARPST